MEFASILGNARWALLSAVADGEKGAAELSEATGSSLANVSQQARLLEAWGLLKRRRGADGRRRAYRLAKELANLAYVRAGYAGTRTFTPTPQDEPVLNILFLPSPEDRYYLQKLLWQHEEYVAACEALALVDSDEKELHLLAIADEKLVERLRAERSSIPLEGPDGASKTAVIWTHSFAEIERGLAEEEEYFRNLLKRPHVIKDAGRRFPKR